MTLTRRDFLKSAAVGMTAFFLPRGTTRMAAASLTDPVLVALFLRGAADGLNIVVPAGDPTYYAIRPTIQVPAGSELPLDGFFGLNPAFASLLPAYQSGACAFIHACGSPDPSRSHFDCQDFMERAAPGNKTVSDGWLNRYLQVSGEGAVTAAITLADAKVKSMAGPARSIAFGSIADFMLTGDSVPERRAALDARYASISGTILGGAVTDALAALDLVASVDTATSVTYPGGELAPLLKDAAALVKADIGVKVIAVNLGGWDHHTDLVNRLGDRGPTLADALAAFHEDLGPQAATTLTLCMTEFGRRPAENGDGGTDHGHGGVMIALGGGIAGGRVLTKDGQWPGLAPGDLFNGQDLMVTTDFRDVFAEALNRHMLVNVSQLGPVFPGFSVSASNFPGLYA
jgi:uncharacterized protein (DUF1501 family)